MLMLGINALILTKIIKYFELLDTLFVLCHPKETAILSNDLIQFHETKEEWRREK